jgi:hypothetical protein
MSEPNGATLGPISFRLTAEDHLALYAHFNKSSGQQKKTRAWRVVMLFTVWLTGLITLLVIIGWVRIVWTFGWQASIALWSKKLEEGFLSILLTIIGCAYLIYWVVSSWTNEAGNPRRVRQDFANMDPRSHDVCVEISPVGITSHVLYETSLMRWPGIQEIASTNEHVFLYTSPIAAIIVPKRAFADPTRCDLFIETVKRFRDEAIKRESGSEAPIREKDARL